MNKLRNKIISKFMLLLVIAGISLFNFSSYTNAYCELDSQEEETCCCSAECSSVMQSAATETIVSDCICVSELSENIAAALHKALFHSGNSNNIVNSSNLTHIHFVKFADFAETLGIKSLNGYVKPADNSSYVLEDVYLFNSILRI